MKISNINYSFFTGADYAKVFIYSFTEKKVCVERFVKFFASPSTLNCISFEQEVEQTEEHWRQESRDLVGMVTRLQDENRRLAEALQESRSDSQDSGKQSTNNHRYPLANISIVTECVAMLEEHR